jgi:hypothetical protein
MCEGMGGHKNAYEYLNFIKHKLSEVQLGLYN